MNAVNGPFESSRDAARFSDWEMFGREAGKTISESNMIQLLGELSGVELGAWDEKVLEWLAGYEPSTVTAVCGLLGRVREQAP